MWITEALKRWRMAGTLMSQDRPNPFLGYRGGALESLRGMRAHPRNEGEKYLASILFDPLADRQIRSFVLPANGMFIARDTPITLNPVRSKLPRLPFILEYAISPDWYKEDIAPGNWRASATVLLVDKVPRQAKLLLWGTWKQECAGESRWNHGQVGITIGTESQIEVYGSGRGRVNASNIDVIALPSEKPTPKQVREIGLNYIDELQVLAQFLTIHASDDILLEKLRAPRQAPGKYYALRCSGPTHYNWLPNSGMVQPGSTSTRCNPTPPSAIS